MSLFKTKNRDEYKGLAAFELFMNVISQPSLISTDLSTSMYGTPYFMYMSEKKQGKGGQHE